MVLLVWYKTLIVLRFVSPPSFFLFIFLVCGSAIIYYTFIQGRKIEWSDWQFQTKVKTDTWSLVAGGAHRALRDRWVCGEGWQNSQRKSPREIKRRFCVGGSLSLWLLRKGLEKWSHAEESHFASYPRKITSSNLCFDHDLHDYALTMKCRV